MNKKLLYFLILIGFVFSYTVYEALKLDEKFSENNFNKTGTVIPRIPDSSNILDLEGNLLNLMELAEKGSNLVVHFWATWCLPCKAELPELIKLARDLRKTNNLKFILIAVNDDKKKIIKFLKNLDLPEENVIIALDENDIHKKFGTYKLPDTYIFKSLTGEIVRKFTNKQAWGETRFLKFFQEL